MKTIASITIVLVNFSIVMSVHFSQVNPESPLRYLTKFTGGQPTNLQHRVAKCQSNDESRPTPEYMAICNAELRDALCTAGVDQEFAEAGLSCNRSTIEEAQSVVNACAKDENGQFCGSLWERYRIRSNYIRGSCSGVLAANSCP